MEKNTETEIKLIIAKKDVKALVASPLVAKKTKKGSHKTVKLVNIYFDTRDLLLHQAGIAYRVRQNGKKYEATVKLGRAEAGGLSARQEYNVAVKNAKPNLSVFDESGLQVDFADILGTAQIEKLFTVRVKREIRLLQITKETVVEMAIDQGFISAGGKKETIDEVAGIKGRLSGGPFGLHGKNRGGGSGVHGITKQICPGSGAIGQAGTGRGPSAAGG